MKQYNVSRRQIPRSLTREDTHSLLKFGMFFLGLIFLASLFAAMLWDQLDHGRGMTFKGQLVGASACAGVGTLLLVLGIPLTMVVVAWLKKSDFLKYILLELEEVAGRDLDNDGMIGAHVMIQTKQNQWMIGQYRVKDPMALVDWASAAVTDKSLAYSRWEDRFGGRKMYQQFRDELVMRGFLLEGRRNRIELTPKGKAYFGQIAMLQPTEILPQLPEPR